MPPKAKTPPPPVVDEPDPASLLPADLPEQSPFPLEWQPILSLACLPASVILLGHSDAYIRLLNKNNDSITALCISDVIAKLDAAHPVAQEIAAAQQAHIAQFKNLDAFGISLELQVKALNARFEKDGGVAWKFEFVRRQAAVQTAVAELKSAEADLDVKSSHLVEAQSAYEAALALLPKQDALELEAEPSVSRANNMDSFTAAVIMAAAEESSKSAAAGAAPLASEMSSDFSPEAAAVAAEHHLSETRQEHDAAAAAAARAAEKAAAARAALDAPWRFYQPYLVHGLCSSASQAATLLDMGLPLRSVVWVHSEVPGEEPELVTVTREFAAAAAWGAKPGAIAVSEVVYTAPPPPPPPPAEPPAPPPEAAGKGKDAKKPDAKKKEEEPPPEPDPQLELHGMSELAAALLTLRDLAFKYDGWSSEARVWELDAPEVPSMAYYDYLLGTVAPERASVAVVMHAMLEQVSRNCQGEESVAAGDAAQATQLALEAIASAFKGFHPPTEDGVFLEETVTKPDYTLVHEGDEVAAAAAGFTTGFIQQLPPRCSSPQSVLEPTTRGSSETSGQGGVGALDVDAVEARMATLLPLPGWQGHGFPATPEMDPVEVSLFKTALKANCKEVTQGAVERYLLLKAFTDMLPEGVRKAHADEVMSRRHIEELMPSILPQTLGRAVLEYPEQAVHYYAPDDALLVALFAGQQQGPQPPPVPCTLTYAQVHDLKCEAGGVDPELAKAVYHIDPIKAGAASVPRYQYPADGTILSTSSAAPLVLRKGPTVVSLASGQQPGLLTTVDGGAVVFAWAERGQTDHAATPLSMVQCCTPDGTVVEVTSEGVVAMFPREQAGVKAPYIRGVDVRGAPVPGFDLDSVALPGGEQWQAALPNGSLVLKSREHGLRVLHPDGSISKHVQLKQEAGSPEEAAVELQGWVRTAQEGQRWRSLQPVVPAPAAAKTEPAQDAAAAPEQAAVAAATDPADTEGAATEADGEALPAEDAPAEEAWEEMPAVAAATVTDADTLAKVTTREDLIMTICYPSGERLMLEPSGRRITTTSTGWLVESAGLPAVEGSSKSVTVQPCPGVKMNWDAGTKVVLVTLGDGSKITIANGAACYTSAGRSAAAFEQAASELQLEPLVHGDDGEVQLSHGRAVQLSRAPGCEGCLVADLLAGAAALWESEEIYCASGPNGYSLIWPVVVPPEPEPVAVLVEEPLEGRSPREPPQSPSPRLRSPSSNDPNRLSSSLDMLDMLHQPSTTQGEQGLEGARQASTMLDAMGEEKDEAAEAFLRIPEVKPLAPAVRPRLFIVHRSGDGVEILATERFKAYLAEHRPTPARQYVSCQVCEMPGSTEPGTTSYQFSTQHQPISRSLAELPIGPGGSLMTYDADKAAQPAHGLVAPRVTALWPPAPHPPAPLAVVSLREITEHPIWSAADLVRLADAVANWQRQLADEQLKMADSSILHPDERSQESQAADGSVLAAIVASRERRIAAGEQIVDELRLGMERQQAVQQAEEADDNARSAAKAALTEKKLRPRPHKSVPYEGTPKRPAVGQPMQYWETQEGLEAREQDPMLKDGSTITRKTLPPRSAPPTAATPGRLGMPGVYLASRTQLVEEDSHTGPRQAVSASASPKRGGRMSPQGPDSPAGRRPSQLAPVDYSYPELGYASLSTSSALPQTVVQRTPSYDVYGQPRQTNPTNLPPLYYADEAPATMNEHHIQAEGDVLALTKTTSTSLIRLQGKGQRQFALTPPHLHLGTVLSGSVVHRTARLQNVGTQRARFSVSRPEPPLRVIYKPGPLAAGMEAALTVEFAAEHVGDFVGEVVVKTELNVLTLSVSAKVVVGSRDAGAPPL